MSGDPRRPVAAPRSLDADARPLPLEAVVEATPTGWSVRLPLRAEAVTVSKQAVVRETVRVWRRKSAHVEAVQATARSERLRREHAPRAPGDAP